MRNLGETSERQLQEVGVHTPDELRAIGAIDAWHRLKFAFGARVNLLFLYALEGALLDCDWRALPPEIKERCQNERTTARPH